MNKETKILSLHPAGQAVPMEENAVPVVVVTPEQLKELIREVIRQELRGVNGHGEEDSLLTADEAAPLLNVTVRWLYRRASKLPFTKRLSRRNLRFSRAGLLRWRDAKKA